MLRAVLPALELSPKSTQAAKVIENTMFHIINLGDMFRANIGRNRAVEQRIHGRGSWYRMSL